MNPLAMVAMKDRLKDVKISVSYNNNNNNNNRTFDAKNLDSIQDKLIKDIIQGDKKVVEAKSRNTIITLEEAANNIKNSR